MSSSGFSHENLTSLSTILKVIEDSDEDIASVTIKFQDDDVVELRYDDERPRRLVLASFVRGVDAWL